MMSTTESAWQASQRRTASRLGQLWHLVRRLSLAYRVYQERRALLALSDRSLKDIGLSRADAYREANRPWWEVPNGRP